MVQTLAPTLNCRRGRNPKMNGKHTQPHPSKVKNGRNKSDSGPVEVASSTALMGTHQELLSMFKQIFHYDPEDNGDHKSP